MPFKDVPVSEVQAYWDARPCNIRHSQKPVDSREYFDEVEARKYFVEYHIPAFADYPVWKDKKVLEIGCGIGTHTVGFAKAGAAQVTAVDISPVSLAHAQKRMEVYGYTDRVKLYEANAEKLSSIVPVEPYDLIYSFGVLHHTPHPEQAMAELRKYAKPGTTLKLMMYYRWSWKVLWMLAQEGFRFDKLEEIVARHSEAQTGCPVTYTYTRQGLKAFVEAQGFEVQDMFVDHIFPYVVADYVQYRYRFEWYFAWMPKPLFRALERLMGWHLCVTAIAR